MGMVSGAMVWEGSLDLARHLASLPTPSPSQGDSSHVPASSSSCPERQGGTTYREEGRHLLPARARLLELGAGHGVPGIVAALRHGAVCDFHDRAADILENVTAANVSANGIALAGGCT